MRTVFFLIALSVAPGEYAAAASLQPPICALGLTWPIKVAANGNGAAAEQPAPSALVEGEATKQNAGSTAGLLSEAPDIDQVPVLKHTRVRRLLPSARGERQAEGAEGVGVSSAGRLEEDPDAPLRQDSIGPVQGKGEDGDAVPLRPFWRKVAVVGTVSAIALAVGAGLYVAEPNPQNAGTKAARQATLAGETGVAAGQAPKVMAPAAALASESPRENSGPVVVELPPVARKSAEIEEVEGFRSGVLSRGGGKEMSPETGHGGASLAPATKVSVPALPFVAASTAPAAAEVGLQTPRLAAKPLVPPSAAPAPVLANGVGSQANAREATPASIQSATAPATRDVAAPRSSEDPSTTVQVASVQASDVAGAPKAVAGAVSPPQGSEPKQISPAQETELYSMITEIATLVHQTRMELAGVLNQQKKSASAVEARLMDFERRLNLGEASRALKDAQSVSITTEAPASAPIPNPAALDAKPGKPPMKGLVTASVRPGEEVNAPVPAPPRYRVQAASPGLAMLADMDRSGEESKPIQVSVGGQLPGFGRVIKLATWHQLGRADREGRHPIRE